MLKVNNLDVNLKITNTTKMAETKYLFGNSILRRSDLEENMDKIVRKAFSNIGFDTNINLGQHLLNREIFTNISFFINQEKINFNIKKQNLFLNWTMDFEIKMSLPRFNEHFDVKCIQRKYPYSSWKSWRKTLHNFVFFFNRGIVLINMNIRYLTFNLWYFLQSLLVRNLVQFILYYFINCYFYSIPWCAVICWNKCERNI